MRYKFIYLSDFILFLICVVGFDQVVEKPSLPVTFEANRLVVERLKSIPPKEVLRIGDEVKSIDGNTVYSQEDLEFLLDAKQIDQTTSVGVKRNNLEMVFNIKLVPFYSFFYLAVQFIVGSLFFFLALFVFSKQKNEIAARLFHWVLIGAALIIFNTWGQYTVNPKGSGEIVRMVFSVAYAFTPVLFLHFTFVFPSEKPRWYSLPMELLYVIAFLFALLMSVTFFHAKNENSLHEFQSYNSIFNYCRLLLVVYVILSIVNFFYSFKYANEESERRKLRWILLGLMTGPLIFVFLWVIPQILTSKGLVNEEIILVAMLSVPITFTISIVRYHIFNIDYLFKRGTVYSIVIAAVLVIIITISSILSLLIGNISNEHSILTSVLSAFVITVAFQPVRNWAQLFVDKKFFRVMYNYRLVEKDFIEQIKNCFDVQHLAEALSNSINANLPVEKSAVYFKKPHGSEKNFILRKNFDTNMEVSQIEELLYESNEASNISGSKTLIEPGVVLLKVEPEILSKLDLALVIKIRSESSGVVGAIILGRKKSGFKFSLEDVDLLNAFAHHAALSLDRINLQSKLSAEQFESQKLKTLNELKSYFVSSVSHEFKTPLTSIQMFAELLEDQTAKKRKRSGEYLEIIKGESARLSRLIDNVLDISKIEKGTKDYRFEETELNEIVRSAVQIMEYQLLINNCKFKARYERTNLPLKADKDALEEVVLNLISNAIKYSTNKKKIKVSTSRKGGFAILEVKDAGIGISKSDVKKIFRPFERVNSGEVRKRNGTGLGLALVKHVIDAHKGKIEVESEENRGSKFRVYFRLIDQLSTKKKGNEKNINS